MQSRPTVSGFGGGGFLLPPCIGEAFLLVPAKQLALVHQITLMTSGL
jgi:hypothetical protein